jgi:hypothetical protein
MARRVYKTIACPNCNEPIEDVEIEVLSASDASVNVGAEWTQPQDAVCSGCGDTITDDDLETLCGDEIQQLIEDSRFDGLSPEED